MTNKISVPLDYTYVAFFPTLRCNLGCSYCLNRFGELRIRSELNFQQLAEGLNRLSFKKEHLPITIQGGEPTIYKDFYALIDSIDRSIPLDLLTNLQFDVHEFVDKLDPRRFNDIGNRSRYPIRISFHAEKMEPERTVQDAFFLKNKGFRVALTPVFDICFADKIEELKKKSIDLGILVYYKPLIRKGAYDYSHFYQGRDGLDGNPKSCLCKTEELIIGPDLSIYRCNRDLYIGENENDNLNNVNCDLTPKFKYCSEFGNCNPCDLIMKEGNSAVKIKLLEEKCKE